MQRTEFAAIPRPRLAAAVFLSWLGAAVHNTLELGFPLWRWENSFPALVGLLLFLAWWGRPGQRRLWELILLIWTAGAHFLIGAILSAVPTPLWPFYPEQSLSHYLSHAIYGAAQLPLIWLLWRAR